MKNVDADRVLFNRILFIMHWSDTEAPLAQSVERETLNLKATGSSPVRGFPFACRDFLYLLVKYVRSVYV